MPRQAVKPVPLVCVSPLQASEATGIRQERISRAVRDREIHAVSKTPDDLSGAIVALLFDPAPSGR
jgi:hypothetical protein